MLSRNVELKLISLVFVLFAFGLNGSDLFLPNFITFNKVGLFIILCLLINLSLSDRLINIFNIAPFIFLLYILIIIGLVSIFFSNFQQDISYIPIINLLLSIFIFIVFYGIIKPLDNSSLDKIVNTIVILAFILTTIFFLYFLNVIIDVGIQNNWQIRNEINDNVSVGLSRIMNGMFIVNSISLGKLVFKITPKYKLVSYFSFFQFIAITIIAGSRQTLLSIIIFTLLMIILKYFTITGFKRVKHTIFIFIFISILSLSLYILLTYFSNSIISSWIIRRFFEDTSSQLNGDYGRLSIILSGIEMAKEHFILGAGPGTFNKWSFNNMYAHNSFANLGSTFGLIALFFFISTILFILLIATKRIITISLQYKNITIIFFSLACTTFFIGLNFNDLIFEYIFWTIFAFVLPLMYKDG